MQRTMQRAHLTTPTRLLLAVVLALALAGCGGDGDSGDDPAATDQTDMDDDEDMGDDEDGDHEEFAFGEPADAADADRTIEVDANDDLSYDPADIQVEDGETITFVVTNTGEAEHEFILGDEAFQQGHEEEMAAMTEEGDMMEHGDSNTLSIAPGETGELTWHFTGASELQYACHEPGHYAGGMIGELTVS